MTLARAQRIARYGGSAPRYTSYPTANHFQPMDHRPLQARLPSLRSPTSVYVHVPYCTKLCWYCGCNTTIKRDRSLGSIFVDDLLRELEQVALHAPHVELQHLALGGGTPNFLTTDQLERLVMAIEDWAPAREGAVRSIELDPRTVEDDQLRALLWLGFDRFSLGVQTLDLAVQQAVNRPFSGERLASSIALLRSRGEVSINVDLMVGLPRQTPATLDGTLATVLANRPERLAVFQYAHVPRMRPAQKLLARHGLPGASERDALFTHAVGRLVDAGYVRVGFDHFALPTDPLARATKAGALRRNFQGFTTDANADLVALGPSAIGRVGDLFTQNERSPGRWREALDAGRLPVARGLFRTPRDASIGEAIEALMCGRGAALDAAGDEREAVEARLRPLVADGLARIEDDQVFVTDAGFDFVRTVASAFDIRLDRNAHAAVV